MRQIKPGSLWTARGAACSYLRVITLAGPAFGLCLSSAVTPALANDPPVQAAPGLPRSPVPTAASKLEADYFARIDKATTPVRNLALSADDAARVRDGARAISAGEVAKAIELQKQIEHPAARKLIDWLRLRAGHGDVTEYRAFLDGNPDWADRTTLTERMENGLFRQGGDASTIKSFFEKSGPETALGFAALASAHLASGDQNRARALAAKVWREDDLPAAFEKGFLDRFGKLLTPADHRWRFNRVLLADRRWTAERSARAAIARRIVPLLPAAEQKKAEARLAVYSRAKNAKALMDALPAETAPDWGVVHHRIQLLRRSGQKDEAIKLMLGAPTDREKIVSPDDWWEERRANAYDALEAGKVKLAYELVKDAGPLSVNPLKDQTFIAGWLALRRLKDAPAAEAHFRAMRAAADGPLSRAKGDYWLARALDAQNKNDEAAKHYRSAAKETDTFHGLLARQTLEPGRAAISVIPPRDPTAEEIARFNASDAVQAAVIAHKSGLGATIIRPFLANLRPVGNSEAWSGLVAHLADSFGDTQMALRIAKNAIASGHNLVTYAYPVSAFAAYSPLRTPPEMAMLLGIARQESEFNTQTISGAGARGVLQVMPITAQHVCRDYKIKCDIPRLLTDRSYNTMVASAYIGDRMKEFDGSYVLTLAGYNAGPGRARQWIKAFGDPRDPKIDVIDWMERIPFEETRQYVAKVLSNIQIYRARLGEEQALRLDEDLGRRRSQATQSPVKAVPPPREARTGQDG